MDHDRASIRQSLPTVVSLFSGCGGLDYGFINEGFEVAAAFDNDKAAVDTYNANFGQHANLIDVTSAEFIQRLDALQTCDVLLGGFPCQGFSKAGPKRADDHRNSLYKAMITALKVLQPKIFIAENVDGLAQNYNGDALTSIVSDCAQSGYSVEWKIVDAAWFGVPQHRRRILIVGIRNDVSYFFSWPQATYQWIARNGEKPVHEAYPNWHPKPLEPKTLGEALSNIRTNDPDHTATVATDTKTRAILKQIPEGSKLCNVRNDPSNVRTWEVSEAYGETSERERTILETISRNRRHKQYGTIPNGNPLSINAISELTGLVVDSRELDDLVRRQYLKKIDSKWDLRGAMFASGIYKRPTRNLPSPTVLTVFGNPRFFAHPIENRPFSVREAARLQSFPDSFRFAPTVGPKDAYRLIGNAVPPRLSTELARAAKLAIESDSHKLQNTTTATKESHADPALGVVA